jgi:hypothetical protein
MNDAKRVSADKRDGEENDFHGLYISPPLAGSVSNVTKRKTPLGGTGFSWGKRRVDNLGFRCQSSSKGGRFKEKPHEGGSRVFKPVVQGRVHAGTCPSSWIL